MKRYKIPTNKAAIIRVAIEILALFVLTYPMMHIYIFLSGDLEPVKRGFFCDDENLKHPNVKEEIKVGECFLIWACIVVFIVPAIELLHVTVFQREFDQKLGKLPWIVVELYRILGYFTMGGFFTLLTTGISWKVQRYFMKIFY